MERRGGMQAGMFLGRERAREARAEGRALEGAGDGPDWENKGMRGGYVCMRCGWAGERSLIRKAGWKGRVVARGGTSV